ncbi:ATP-binding protein [Propioniciclava flava]|uniref:histidine kinase n=1 Tax=Propioniciclava flava TaxID=2072026 RepID=A0A4Q2EJN0_9ACTN|nr:ATP-binding protein [Propioniciclava flava]RXW32916.1 hypothetical protein C1706_03280 [Propioniciclava flava]
MKVAYDQPAVAVPVGAGSARIGGLDGVRALSVAAVLLYHVSAVWAPGGFAGVDVFFVVSGYLITTLLVREHDRAGRINLPAFYVRRARRLLPAAIATVTVTGLAALVVGGDVLVGLPASFLGIATFSQNWVMLAAGNDYFAQTRTGLFDNFWSLAIEEQFYLVWPSLLALCFTSGRAPRAGGLGFAAVLAVAAPFVMSASGMGAAAYLSTFGHLFGLVIGVWLAVLLSARHAPTDPRPGTTVAGAAIVATTGVLVSSARQIIYQARQNAILAEYRDATDAVRQEISADPSGVGWDSLARMLPRRSAIVVPATGRIAGNLTAQEIPASWLDPASQPPAGALRYLRTTLGGDEVFLVGLASFDPASAAPTVLIVSSYSLEPQRQQVMQLVTAAVVIGGAALLVTGTAGFLIARTLTQPLRRLTAMARALGEGETPPATTSTFTDVNQIATALHESGTRLATTMTELARREHDARRLVSDVAHELRTPLTSMTAVAEIIEEFDQATHEERAIAMTVTSRGVRRLTVLMEQLLELSRIDAGAATVTPSPLGVRELLTATVQLLDPDRVVDVQAPTGLSVTTDADRLHTIVANLLSNALHHGAPPVTVSAETAAGHLVVSVRDEGPGIPAEHAADVFERFVTLDTARHNPASNGLGLAIARDNARLLGGELTLQETTTGACFRLTLPLV